MDDSYLRFARSLVTLGEAFEQLCRLAPSSNPRIETVRVRAFHLVRFGRALGELYPSLAQPWTPAGDVTRAAAHLDEASVALVESRITPVQLKAALLTANSALADVLPGIPDLPDLPKPTTIPPDDVAEVVRSAGQKPSSRGEES